MEFYKISFEIDNLDKKTYDKIMNELKNIGSITEIKTSESNLIENRVMPKIAEVKEEIKRIKKTALRSTTKEEDEFYRGQIYSLKKLAKTVSRVELPVKPANGEQEIFTKIEELLDICTREDAIKNNCGRCKDYYAYKDSRLSV